MPISADPFIVLCAAIIAAVALIVVLSITMTVRGERSRATTAKALAAELEMTYTNEDRDLARGRRIGLGDLSQNRSVRIRHLVRGEVGDLTMTLCDYSYLYSAGKTSHRAAQTLMIVEVPGNRLPVFRLGTQTLLHTIGRKLGMHDIDFEAHPAFSRRFTLSGPDESAIRARFTPEVIALIESFPQGMRVESTGNCLLLYRYHKRIERPDDLAALITDSAALATELIG